MGPTGWAVNSLIAAIKVNQESVFTRAMACYSAIERMEY